jgi:hypothetical protein
MHSPADARPQTAEIEVRARRNERGSENKRIERLRIKLKQMQERRMQMDVQIQSPRAS